MKKFLIMFLFVSLAASGCSLGGGGAKVVSAEEAKKVAEDFINENLMQSGTKATIKEIVEENNLFKLTVSLPNDQEIVSYLSQDGEKFFPQVYDIQAVAKQAEEKAAAAAAAQEQALSEMPQTDRPVVELFVMSFCPYGVQAEEAMAPVVKILGAKADIKLRYIASLEGNDIKKVSSLHGPIEGLEDMRQLCAAKNYSQEKLWDYVMKIKADCYPVYSQGEAAYDKCWRQVAADTGLDAKKLDLCVSKEGAVLIKAEDQHSQENSVSGSPTLIINGQKVNPARTPEGYKQTICGAFNTAPEECGEVLAATAAAADGSCD